jgi:hypothetical protein
MGTVMPAAAQIRRIRRGRRHACRRATRRRPERLSDQRHDGQEFTLTTLDVLATRRAGEE